MLVVVLERKKKIEAHTFYFSNRKKKKIDNKNKKRKKFQTISSPFIYKYIYNLIKSKHINEIIILKYICFTCI